ncbi:MAG TPA: TonB-dependent receptor [Microscillaceae bacterium]|nr:TonB-dependent receptor [Microscillaceae bacterium]
MNSKTPTPLFLWLLLLSCLYASDLTGQNTQTITGIVKDKISGESLPYATIGLKGTNNGTSTNTDGYFTLFNVPSDGVLIVSYLGYQTAQITLTPQTVKTQLVIQLNPDYNELKEVVVTDKKDQFLKVSENISQISISPAQIATLPSLGEKDIFRSMQLLPGVSGTNETSAGLFVRGGTPDQNLVLLDGFTVYQVDHFYGFFSAFNSNAIKDIQLYKGGFDAQFGGRLSSVMELTGKSGNTQKVGVEGGVSLLSANATIEVPLLKDKASLLIAGRRSYTDILKSNLFQNIFDLVANAEETPEESGFVKVDNEPSFYFYDFNAKLSFKPTSKDMIALSYYSGEDNLDNSRKVSIVLPSLDIIFDTRDFSNWGNQGTSLKWARQWNSRFYTNTVVAYSRYFSNRDRETDIIIDRADTTSTTITIGTLEDNQLQDVTARIDNEWLISAQHRIEFGLQATYNDIAYDYSLNDTVPILQRDGIGLLTAAYVQDQWKVTPQFTLNFGVRGSHFDVTNQYYLEPRASASFQLNKRIKLKAAWGQYYQFMNRIVREDISQGSRDFWLLADNQDNPVSNSVHYIAGVSYETPLFLFDVEVYHKDMTGLTEFTLRLTPTSETINTDNLFFGGTGYAQGVEFLLQKKTGIYSGWIGYTLSRVRYNFPGISAKEYPALHDQTHELKIINSLKLGQWTFAATWLYATGKPYTAPVGSYNVDLLDGTSNDYLNISAKNAIRLPAYHRLDFSVTFKFNLTDKTKANAGISVFNLYNQKNIWYKEFDIIDNEVIETDINYLGFTPNLFFNLKF